MTIWHILIIIHPFACIYSRQPTGHTTACYTGCRRPLKCTIVRGHFTQKSPTISGSFAKNDMQGTYPCQPTGHTTARDTGWRRPIGRLKLEVIFRKRATNYRALLRTLTYTDKASYGSSPPCTDYTWLFGTFSSSFTPLHISTHFSVQGKKNWARHTDCVWLFDEFRSSLTHVHVHVHECCPSHTDSYVCVWHHDPST